MGKKEKNSERELWNQVKYIGYKKIPSMATRKLVFFKAYNNYDPEKNDCFVAYYSQYINYAASDIYRGRRGILTLTSRAWKAHERKSKWPTFEDKPETQGENILSNFIAKF